MAVLGVLAGALLPTSAWAVESTEDLGGLTYRFDPDFPERGAVVVGGSSSVTNVTIPDSIRAGDVDYSVTGVADSAFAYGGVTSVSIGTSVVSIGASAFEGNLLTSLKLPNGLREIGDQAFAFNSLASLEVDTSLESVGTLAFYQNALTSATLPGSVNSIGFLAFGSNPLTALRLQGPPPSLSGTIADWPQPLLEYPWRFDSATYPGGYTTPNWNDLPSVPLATVMFNSAGGTSVEPQLVRADGSETAAEPQPPSRSGFAFGGWYLSSGELYDFQTAVDRDYILTARWISAPSMSGPPALPATVQTALSFAPDVSGDLPLFFDISGSLPSGLSFDPATGSISGVPIDRAGDYLVTITATNAAGASTLDVVISLSAGPVASLSVSLDPRSPSVGIETRVDVQGFDVAGNPVGSLADVTLTSSAPEDTVRDLGVTFASAGTRTLTLFDSVSGVRAAIRVEVASAPSIPPSTVSASPVLPLLASTGQALPAGYAGAGIAAVFLGVILLSRRRGSRANR